MAILLILFIAIPILELVILIRLGQSIGFWPTLAIVLFAGFAGASLARAQGMRAFVEFQRELAQGRIPTAAMQDGLAILAGGALLLTPGFISDVLGLGLLFKPTRRVIQGVVRRWLERQVRSGRVRVTTLGGMGFGTGGPAGPPDAGARQPGERQLDPRKGIDVPYEEEPREP